MRQTKHENTMINVCTMRVSTTDRVSIKVLYIFSFVFLQHPFVKDGLFTSGFWIRPILPRDPDLLDVDPHKMH